MGRDSKRSVGFWGNLMRQSRLGWRLLWDPRVPLWTKIVPLIGVIYILSPIDFIPDWFLGVGQLDDLGALIVGLRLFIELVPEDVLLRHLEQMGVNVGSWQVVEDEPPPIEAEYQVRDE